MLSSDFIKAWRDWLRRPVPASNFRNGRTGSPAYVIEHDIDHAASYIQGLVESLIAGKELDFQNLAAKELAEMHQLVAKLNDSELNGDEKQQYLGYLSDMTFLLREIERTGSSI